MRTLEKPFSVILGEAWTVYSKNFKFIVVLVALTFVPIFVFRTFLPEHLYLANQRFMELAQGYFAGEVDFATLVAGASANVLLYEVLNFGILLVFFPLLVAGAVYLSRHHLCASDPEQNGCPHCKNEPPSFDNMFANVFTP
ncbi:MAG: hypothetical protein FWB74_07450, partial [Defluviitaleaceae bacterium]|nr:hypothetical protein [Defluviitaleaceae bacterium]